MLYKHIKTGNIYRHLAFGRDCTNDRDGTRVIIYQPIHNRDVVYVRDQTEHDARFETLAEDPQV